MDTGYNYDVRFALPLLLTIGFALPTFALSDGEMSGRLGNYANVRNGGRLVTVIYLNGQNTESDAAVSAAMALADRLHSPVRLIFNDLTLPVIDWFSTAIEKSGNAGTSVNGATRTLVKTLHRELDSGHDVWLVGHSAGTLSINNAVRRVAHDYRKLPASMRVGKLSRIHVVSLGGAVFDGDNVFSDGWPAGLGSVHDLRDARDGVSNTWGHGDFWDWFDCDFDEDYHAADRYILFVTPSMFRDGGNTVIFSNSLGLATPLRTSAK